MAAMMELYRRKRSNRAFAPLLAVLAACGLAAFIVVYIQLAFHLLNAERLTTQWHQQNPSSSLFTARISRRHSGRQAAPSDISLEQDSPFSRLSLQQPQPRNPQVDIQQAVWSEFWSSGVVDALRNLQALREQLSQQRYQHLKKDVEPQDTGGLDVALADTLNRLVAQTQLQEAQVWLKEQVTSAVFHMLSSLQHPADCASARKLVCDFNKGCGFGCQLHHAVHCFTHAVALNRTMVMQVEPWRYSPGRDGEATWEELMAPVSSCGMQHLQKDSEWPAVGQGRWHEEEPEVFVEIIDNGATWYDPPSMPPDVLELVGLFNSRPEYWWIGVLGSYLLRPSAKTIAIWEEFRQQHAWQSPIVGVHVRRTDKVTSGEAKFHGIDEYMTHVERYCDLKLESGWQLKAQQAAGRESSKAEQQQLLFLQEISNQSGAGDAAAGNTSEQAIPVCSIYLATDEPSVVDEIRRRYKHIHLITNPAGLTTGVEGQRDTTNGAAGIYNDIMLLAATDFLVGTFSSQVSRAAYEIAQVNGSLTDNVPDPSLNYHTVDSMWYYGGMIHYDLCVAHDYTSAGQQRLNVGQHIDCGNMFKYSAGYAVCRTMAPSGNPLQEVLVPPGIITRCPGTATRPYRPVLPPHMRNPAWPKA